MTKLLNLDDLATPELKTIRLNGFDHFAEELTVQRYIDRVQAAKRIELNPAPEDVASNVMRAMELINEVFPTLTPAMLGTRPLAQLQTIIEFALAAPEDIAKAAEARAVEQGQAANPILVAGATP